MVELLPNLAQFFDALLLVPEQDIEVPKILLDEDGTETHQAEINRKIKANDKLWKFLLNLEDHRVIVDGDSFKSKMQSLDDEKNAALLAAKRQFLPLQSRIDKQKNYLERVSKEIETKQKKRLEILQIWIEADQELVAANSEWTQAKHEMALLVAEQSAENAKAVHQRHPGVQTHTTGSSTNQAAQQTFLSVFKSVLSMQSMGCHQCFGTAHGGWRDG